MKMEAGNIRSSVAHQRANVECDQPEDYEFEFRFHVAEVQ